MSNTRRTPTPTNEEKDAFLDAVKKGYVSKVRDMLRNNRRLANISDPLGETGWTPLFAASIKGHYRIVKLLLDSGVNINPNKATNDGFTPLYAAAMYGHDRIVELLFEAEVDVNKATNEGKTPLFIAAMYNNNRIVKLLLDAEADPNKADENGFAPLYIAAMYGNDRIVKLLLESEADPNQARDNGETPLSVAEMYGRDRIVRIIKEYQVKHRRKIIIFRAAMDTASKAEERGMYQDEALEIFKKIVKGDMEDAGDSDFDVDNSQIHSKLYNYFQGIMKSRHKRKRSKTRTRFGKGKSKSKSNGKSKKPQKRPSSAVCRRAQKLGVRLTLKRNNKRVYKSEEMLRKQIKNAVNKRNKRKQTKK